jgi:hypothetical protein
METLKFKTGTNYEMRFIGDSDLRVIFTCIKLTEKTATFKNFQNSEVITKKIKVYDNCEFIKARSYSMAPSISANHNR